MKVKIEIEIEFDPAKNRELLSEGRRLFLERSSEHSIVDDAGTWRDAKPEEVGPEDAVDGLLEIVQCAIDDYDVCERLGITVHGMECDGPELKVPIN